MHRQDLLDKLANYQAVDDRDVQTRREITDFVRSNPACFERSLRVGHITCAAWLLDAAGRRVLLTHHRKLRRWLQLGGHADGNPNVVEAAMREAREESGMASITLLSEDIFDLDVHEIPAHGDEPAHYHYDIRFLMQAGDGEAFEVSDESLDLAWFSSEQLADLDLDYSVTSMIRKWLALRTVIQNRA